MAATEANAHGVDAGVGAEGKIEKKEPGIIGMKQKAGALIGAREQSLHGRRLD